MSNKNNNINVQSDNSVKVKNNDHSMTITLKQKTEGLPAVLSPLVYQPKFLKVVIESSTQYIEANVVGVDGKDLVLQPCRIVDISTGLLLMSDYIIEEHKDA